MAGKEKAPAKVPAKADPADLSPKGVAPVSQDGSYWKREPSSEEFPADQGPQVQQVYVGLPSVD
jgi:hypothetical protein